MKKLIAVGFVLAGFLVVAGTAAQIVPVAVSPGSERGVAIVGQTCPTFSWTAVDWAAGYRVAVFEALSVQAPSYEEVAAGTIPVLSKEIAGRALSWTPSAEEPLNAGSLYVWYVQAADASGQGTWSKGRLFIVEAGMLASAVEGNLRKTLEEKGVREDVISDVLTEMKGGGQGVLSGKTDSKLRGRVGALGSEGVNTYYGDSAGASITSGASDTFIGRYAGQFNTSGSSNTFLGHQAGYSNTTASDNTFLGYGAGNTNTTGDNNSFLGSAAGVLNTTGSYNLFLGSRAGHWNTVGSYNMFLGNYAGYVNTASYNTFLGNYSGTSNTSGNNNTFLGYYSGYTNSTGSSNTFLGYYTGYSNTTGTLNTFLGQAAGYASTTGTSNTFLGYDAGVSNTTGNYNAFVGTYAGYTNTTGNYNTCLGSYAGYYNNDNGNIFIGYQAGLSETGSGKLYIANSSTSAPLVYGNFSTGILGINGWLGVGTQSPAYPMEVKTSGRNSVLVVQRDGGALNFMNASTAYGQFGTGNAYPVRILVNSAWRMSLNLDNSLTLVNGASCTAGGVWTNASSRELKENIEDLSPAEAEEALRALAPVKYKYKADNDERHVGFIAEDVPELVASKDRKTMSPMNVVGVLTKVVQELERTVQEQKRTISSLNDRIAKIELKGNTEK